MAGHCHTTQLTMMTDQLHRLPQQRHNIQSVEARDVRWPTSADGSGSDGMHTDPDYSCVYVTIRTDSGRTGFGLVFTLGRGTNIVQLAVQTLADELVRNRNASDIFARFGEFWRELTSESQLRWLGPEKGVMHLAVAAIVNALWDLWAKLEQKPVWKLLADMEPEVLVSTIDFRYISDVITPKEAIDLLHSKRKGQNQRLAELLSIGYPAYTTQIGWIGYSEDRIRKLCKEYLAKGFTAFKLKVGRDLQSDIRRCRIVREEIGWQNQLMIDANQVWDVREAIEWVSQLKDFQILWIEEPTSPDDILGHASIARALEPLGIGVATGEMCANRVMFKQFLQANALQFCQIDSCRMGGVNEILAVYLMAAKLNVKVCPHAGGVGLCEMVQHLQMWDFVSLSGTSEGRYIEYVDQQHDQFKYPAVIKNAHYMPPLDVGYSTELLESSLQEFEFPVGSYWANASK